VEPGAGLDDSCGFLPTWDILHCYDSAITALPLLVA